MLNTYSRVGIAVLLSGQLVHAQTPAAAAFAYRGYALGSNLATVAAQAAVPVSAAEVIHQLPAVMTDLKWSAPYSSPSGPNPSTDPVQDMRFSFYEDQLFRIVIDYARERTEGMTDADMIEGISATYGAVSKQPQKPLSLSSQLAQDTGRAVAAWGRADASAILYRQPYEAGFRLIVTSTRLDTLARTAAARATRLEELGGPAKEAARAKKEAEELRLAREKARIANKAAFKP